MVLIAALSLWEGMGYQEYPGESEEERKESKQMKNGEIININGKRIIFFHEEEGCSGCAFQNNSSCPEDCEDGKFFELPNPWHTGEPTEGGMYLVVTDIGYDVWEFNEDFQAWHLYFDNVKAWRKIEPYKEQT